MKNRITLRYIITILSIAILFISCGDAFMDITHTNSSITAIEDPNSKINPRIQKIPEPEAAIVTEAPTDFNLQEFLRILNGINSPEVQLPFKYTTVDLKKTTPVENETYTYDSGSEISNISSKVEGDNYILTYTYQDIPHKITQYKNGKIRCEHMIYGELWYNEWVTGTDGSHYDVRSERDGSFYYSSTDSTTADITSYAFEDTTQVTKERNIFKNGLEVELITNFENGEVSGKSFVSTVSGRKNEINYTRTATTNELTGKLIKYKVEMGCLSNAATTYAVNTIKNLTGMEISLYDSESEIILSQDTFSWQLNEKKTTEVLKKHLLDNEFKLDRETDRRIYFNKGDIKIEVLKNPGKYDIEFTFPIANLPDEFQEKI